MTPTSETTLTMPKQGKTLVETLTITSGYLSYLLTVHDKLI
jgi:hypothetical protein